MSLHSYETLLAAWAERMRFILAGDPTSASAVWSEAYWSMPEGTEIEWVRRDDGGTDCIVSGTMYFEDTATGPHRARR